MVVDAERAYKSARRLSSDLSGGYNNLGRLYTRLGRDDEAGPLLETAVSLDPYNVQAWVNLGRAYQREGRPAAAEQAYQRALLTDAEYAPAFNNLGLLLGELGRPQQTRQMLHRAIEVDPSYSAAAVNLKLLELNSAGIEGAAAYRQVLADYPNQVGFMEGVGGECITVLRLDRSRGRVPEGYTACRQRHQCPREAGYSLSQRRTDPEGDCFLRERSQTRSQ
jgi:tetratricopeptide (TPR) repeat protein